MNGNCCLLYFKCVQKVSMQDGKGGVSWAHNGDWSNWDRGRFYPTSSDIVTVNCWEICSDDYQALKISVPSVGSLLLNAIVACFEETSFKMIFEVQHSGNSTITKCVVLCLSICNFQKTNCCLVWSFIRLLITFCQPLQTNFQHV